MLVSEQPLRIGNASQRGATLPGDNHHFHGPIDEVRVYDEALTPCQQLALTPVRFTGAATKEDEDGESDTTTTAVSLPLSELGIAVYPNPTSDLLYVASPDDLDYEVVLYDPAGNRLYLRWSTGRVDLMGLPSGLYILRFITRDGTAVIQVFKR